MGREDQSGCKKRGGGPIRVRRRAEGSNAKRRAGSVGCAALAVVWGKGHGQGQRDKNKDRGKDRVKDSVSSLPRCRKFPLFAPEHEQMPVMAVSALPRQHKQTFPPHSPAAAIPPPSSLLHPPKAPPPPGFCPKTPQKEKGRAAERGAGAEGCGGSALGGGRGPAGMSAAGAKVMGRGG